MVLPQPRVALSKTRTDVVRKMILFFTRERSSWAKDEH